MFRSVRVMLAAALAAASIGGAPAGPTPTPAPVQGQQAHPEPVRRGRKALRNSVPSVYLSLSHTGGQAPWVDRHNYLLRPVRRAMPRRIR